MIKDKLDNINRYALNQYFENFKDFLKGTEAKNFKKIEKPFKAIPLEYNTGKWDLSKFENHERFIDIHYIIKGEEQIGLASVSNLHANMEYDSENDYQLFDGTVNETVILKEGDFLLLFPGEAHVTGGSDSGVSIELKKIVFKVPL